MWCLSGSPELLDWKRAIEDIEPHLAPSNLAIKMIFPPCLDRIYGHPAIALDRHPAFSKEEFQHRKECYFNTVLPLRRLGRRLRYLSVCINGDREEPGGGTAYTEEWSRELEEMIMGDPYEQPTQADFVAIGRPEPLFMRTGCWFLDGGYCSSSNPTLL
jgi:hypothetical protein